MSKSPGYEANLKFYTCKVDRCYSIESFNYNFKKKLEILIYLEFFKCKYLNLYFLVF